MGCETKTVSGVFVQSSLVSDQRRWGATLRSNWFLFLKELKSNEIQFATSSYTNWGRVRTISQLWPGNLSSQTQFYSDKPFTRIKFLLAVNPFQSYICLWTRSGERRDWQTTKGAQSQLTSPQMMFRMKLHFSEINRNACAAGVSAEDLT